jgi:hypothetical protein
MRTGCPSIRKNSAFAWYSGTGTTDLLARTRASLDNNTTYRIAELFNDWGRRVRPATP